MNLFKNHIDAIALGITIISVSLTSVIWMNGKFNEIEKEIAIIKTVLIMQKILPSELASTNIEKPN